MSFSAPKDILYILEELKNIHQAVNINKDSSNI